ncbi:uroporphyrinogen-III synthase [Sphingobium jiangsuense]|uniref:Uroporphyrinogen-III synthase n=1 Tax=Sphingobium jiangsuense TaxID=870476 RepID=A0A7W6FQM8_9SPHN|nr:uroporphyrinogen-III synthase [Sphingobium jiangsuense]MBB3926174.1 uroporphyrinogen-III synthase [Sphingobium jiangsuense]
MTGAAPALLVCRPQPGAEATARRARAMGMEALVYPLFRVEPLAWDAPDPAAFDALMLSSANGLRHGGPKLALYHDLPVVAVGEPTAEAARAHGFRRVTVAGPDARAMIAALGEAGHRHVLHLCGADYRKADPGALRIVRRPVYRAVEAGSGEELAPLLQRADIVLAHSPRAAQRLAALIPAEARARLALVAISPAARDAAGEGWRRALAAPTPDDPALLVLARQICQ